MDKFYIGITRGSVDGRIEKHNNSFYGNKHFTSNASDWEKYLVVKCTNYKQATSVEKHLKKMKSRQYFRNLKLYPEIIQRLLQKYSPGANH
jgi:putative endonuclease